MVNKQYCLTVAIEITKEYARGGTGSGACDAPAEVLEKTYKKLLELAEVKE